MVNLGWIFMALVLFLLGSGVARCLYGKNDRECTVPGEVLPAGFCVMIGVAQVAHVAAVFLHWPVSRVALLWAGVIGILAAVGLVVVLTGHRRRKGIVRGAGVGTADGIGVESAEGIGVGDTNGVGSFRGKHTWRMSEQLLAGAFALSVLLQIIVIMTGDRNCVAGDMTLETVRSFLTQDQVYQVNPLTGQAYTTGVPLRLKILGLPSLYASLCSLTGLDAELVVYRMMPVVVLLLSYLAYSVLGKELFGQDETGRLLMLLVISVLYWFGDYMDSMDGFLLLHSGYRGVAIRNGVLIPFVLGMCLKRKWKAVVLAILAEACIVWTLYGLGACFLVSVLMLLVDLWIGAKGRRGGKTCRSF